MRGLASLAVLALVAAPLGAQTPEELPGWPLYVKYCAQCHGDDGRGEGIAADRLKPRPRDFTSGKYKVRSTPTGSLPTDADLAEVIREGLPYTAMPGFHELSSSEIDQLVAVLKAFAPSFASGSAEPIALPGAPAMSDETVAAGRTVYEETGCLRCHGDLGRGDGMSAPTLRDDWGHHIRAADLSMPWTFRGGGTREDIYRTMATGFNGTPMPGFHGALAEEDIWRITDYIWSLSGKSLSGDVVEAPYAKVVSAVGAPGTIDLANWEEQFAEAPVALFPLFGQIVEPGRNFYPSASAVWVQVIYDEDDVAFLVRWHDMRAETSGHNAPDLPVPEWREQLAEIGAEPSGEPADDAAPGESTPGDDPFADDVADEDPFADDVADDVADEDPFADDVADEDPFADDTEDDFWGDEGGGDNVTTAATGGLDSEFSDAVAIQVPRAMPAGVGKPYFLFGDVQNPVDLWFLDLARDAALRYEGRGSGALVLSDAEPPEVVKRYDRGEWAVVFKRPRRSMEGIAFSEETFVPVAFSVWDGFNRERGNKRALSSWFHVYLEPLEEVSPWGPMLRVGGLVLLLEVLVIALVRRRRRRDTVPAAEGSVA